MTTSAITETFPYDINKVWDIVTSLTDYAWRSDIEHIEIIEPGKKFNEYSKDGFFTSFKITTFNECERYEFDIDNTNMHGHWIGEFKADHNQTTITFTEQIEVKKMIMKPFVKGFLKRQQNTYINNLRSALAKK